MYRTGISRVLKSTLSGPWIPVSSFHRKRIIAPACESLSSISYFKVKSSKPITALAAPLIARRLFLSPVPVQILCSTHSICLGGDASTSCRMSLNHEWFCRWYFSGSDYSAIEFDRSLTPNVAIHSLTSRQWLRRRKFRSSFSL